MGLGQLLQRAQPALEAALMQGDGESNLDMLRRLATPKFTGLRPRNQQQSTDEGNVPMLQPRDSMMPVDPNRPDVDPGFTPRTTGPSMALGAAPALAATSDDSKLLDRSAVAPYPGAPDMSRISPDEILRTTARLRERALSPATAGEAEPMGETGLMRRPTQATQPVEEIDNGGRSVEGLIYDEHGRPLKPHYLEPASDAALMGRQEYINALQAYEPQNHNSGLVSSLLSAGRGALAGSPYGIGGMMGGALEGGVHGLIDRSLDEKYAKRRDIGEAQGEMAGDFKFRQAQSDLQNEETTRLLQRSTAYRNMNPTGNVLETDSGYYRSAGTTAEPITAGKGGPQLLPRAKAGAARVDYRENPATGQLEAWEIRQGEPDKRMPNKDMIKSQFGWVTPGTALSADATAENRNWQRGRQEQQDTQHITERGEDKTQHTQERTEARIEKAAAIIARIDAARKVWIDADAQAQLQPSYKAHFEGIRDKAGAEAAGAAAELNTGFSDLYEAGQGERGLAYYKPKSQTTGGRLQPRAEPKKGKGKDPLGLFSQ